MRALGCLLLIVSIVVMAVLVVLPVLGPFENNPLLMSVQTILHCPAGSRFEQEFTNYSDFRGQARQATSYCVDAEGQRTRVPDERLLVAGALGFVIPFLIGLFLLIGGISRSVSRRAASFASIGVNAGDDVIDVGGMKVRISQSPPIVFGASTTSIPSGASGESSLTAKLQQVKEALDKGLITQDEYDRLRKEILDSSF